MDNSNVEEQAAYLGLPVDHKKMLAPLSIRVVAPTQITEADLGLLLGQLLYDPVDERVVSEDRGLITDVELVQTKPETD